MTKEALLEILTDAATEIEDLACSRTQSVNQVVIRLRRAIAEINDSDYWQKRVDAVDRNRVKQIIEALL